MDSHTNSYKSPDPEVSIQSVACINGATRPLTQTDSARPLLVVSPLASLQKQMPRMHRGGEK